LIWLRCLGLLKSNLRDRGLTVALSGIRLLRYLSSLEGLTALSIMALTPLDIAQQAGETARNIMGVPAGLLADQAAEYIKSGGPTPIIPNIGVAVARQACRRYADNPDGVPGAAAGGFERVCRPYLDDIGYGQGPTIDKPFEGGQCAGVVYTVRYRYNSINTDGTLAQPPTESSAFVVGPIGGIRGSGSPAFQNIEISGQNGYEAVRSGNCAQGCFANIELVSITPTFGGADSCGDPPPVVSPPVPPPGTPPTKEPFSPTPGTNIDIDVTIGPTGDITFNIGTGPITIDPFGGGGDGGEGVDSPGDDKPGTAPSSGLPPGDIGQPAEPIATPPGGTASGCAPPNSVLVGVKVNILEPLPPVSQYDEQVLRGVCYVYMGVVGNLALDPSGVALRNGQFCLAPVDNLTCWEVRANVNFILRVTPYYRALEAQEV
jgi:hypothetical protein